jgi:hypothetical protein
MIIFPPWVIAFDPPTSIARLVRAERPAGYHLLFGNHIPEDPTEINRMFGQFWGFEYYSVRLDSARLFIQFVGLLILTVILFLVFGKTRKESAL